MRQRCAQYSWVSCFLCGGSAANDVERKQGRTGRSSYLDRAIMISVPGMCIGTVATDNSFIISRRNIMLLISKVFCPCFVVYGHCERFER